MPRFLRRLPMPLRAALIGLLVLGTVVRPMLFAHCDVHALLYGHVAQPHVHDARSGADPSDPGDPGDGDTHGLHELMQLGSAAVDLVPSLTVPALAFGAMAMPRARVLPLPDDFPSELLRPPNR